MMARTVYTPENAAHSEIAHIAARHLLYPLIFGVDEECLGYESVASQETERQHILDGEMAVDRIVKVPADGLAAPLAFTIQERFRRRYKRGKEGQIITDYMRYGDITITEWNHRSGQPSELYKMTGGFFVYAYYDEVTGIFWRPVMVNVPGVLLSIVARDISCAKLGKNPKEQTFLPITYTLLEELGLVVFYRDSVPCGYSTPLPRVTNVVTLGRSSGVPPQGEIWPT